VHGLLPDWPAFLDDFQNHWPTDQDHTYVDFVRDGSVGNGAARMGNSRWRRLTEERAGGAKSVFHFDVQGQVAKSTHAGIPWLRFIRQRLGTRVHFWPFDGWDIAASRSAIAEVYPALWSRSFARQDRTGDQHDAFSIAAWLSRADRDGRLASFLKPELTPTERAVAQVEGWILGMKTSSSRETGLRAKPASPRPPPKRRRSSPARGPADRPPADPPRPRSQTSPASGARCPASPRRRARSARSSSRLPTRSLLAHDRLRRADPSSPAPAVREAAPRSLPLEDVPT
jgi:hypothetical protein